MADMSKKSTFLDMHQFETYINGFLDLEYPNFYLKYGFLSSIEAEIISFLPNKAEFIVMPQRPLIQKIVLLSAL